MRRGRAESNGETLKTDTDQGPLVEVRDLTFSYPGAAEPVIKNLSLSISSGEFVILAGPSGCGKSTLCRHLNGIIPHLSSGEIVAGEVLIDGKRTWDTPIHELSCLVGMVHQNPESQIICLSVEDEIAFGPENLGLSHEEIVARVEEVAKQVGVYEFLDCLTFECSGGEKQKLAIASSLALYPELLVMDEPTTDLDPVASREIVSLMKHLCDVLGITFLVVEHNLDELLEIADRLIIMEKGRIALDGPPRRLIAQHYEDIKRIGVRIPQYIKVAHELKACSRPSASFSVQHHACVDLFGEWVETIDAPVTLPDPDRSHAGEVPSGRSINVLELDSVSFTYDGKTNAVDNVSLEVSQGEFVAVVGANGSGKSTLARLMMGLLHPDTGTVSIMGKDVKGIPMAKLSQTAGYLFQNPDSQLFNHTVESEIAFGMETRGVNKQDIEQRVDRTLKLLNLERYKGRHPFSLSRGERQRLALATVLVTDPDIIILDEPTTGQDRKTLHNLMKLMRRWIERKNATVLMISHDMSLVSEHASRVVVVSSGHIVFDGPTERVFCQHFEALRHMHLLPPPIVELSRPFVNGTFSRVLLSFSEWHRLFELSDWAQAVDAGR